MANDSEHDVSANRETTAAEPAESYSQYLGVLLKGRYQIEQEIGRGGLGVVYLARDQQLLARQVVIKVLVATNADQTYTDWFQKKFRQEMEALVRINHPGVVAVLDTGEMPDGKPFIVMQYVQGVTLRAEMNRERPGLARAANLARQMGQALSAAHAKGVCHRDLKPENIMLEPLGGGQEQVKLIDFGIARVNDSQVGTNAELTWVAGTPPYMSPEQLRGRPTTESDIYSFGAVMYEILTGDPPFKAKSTVDLYELQRQGELVPPKQLRPEIPEAAQTAILKALSFSVEHRYRSALEFGEELANALLAGVAPGTLDTDPGLAQRAIATTLPQREARETSPDLTRVSEAAPNRFGAPAVIVLIAALLAALALVIALTRKPTTPKPSGGSTAQLPERSLTYWIVARKYRSGKPFGEPFRLPGEIMFNAEDRAVLHLAAAQPGAFYLLNEGPAPVNGRPSYVLLFPKPTVNGGSAEVRAAQELRFPEQGDGFEFDRERGTEKLWLIWAARPLPELEAVKSVVNERERGAVTDPARIDALQKLLTQPRAAAAQKDEANQQTRVAGRGDMLIHPIQLLHY